MFIDIIYNFCLKHISLYKQLSEIVIHVNCVKCPLFVRAFNKIFYGQIIKWKLKYEVLSKSVHWETSCSKEGQTDMKKIVVLFFVILRTRPKNAPVLITVANAPQKRPCSHPCCERAPKTRLFSSLLRTRPKNAPVLIPVRFKIRYVLGKTGFQCSYENFPSSSPVAYFYHNTPMS